MDRMIGILNKIKVKVNTNKAKILVVDKRVDGMNTNIRKLD